MKKILYVLCCALLICNVSLAAPRQAYDQLQKTCDCPGCDLKNVNLQNFKPAENPNFQGKICNFTGADLSFGNFKDSNFSGNVIRAVTASNASGESVLQGSNFTRSNLTHANFENALLIGVIFHDAQLEWANLSGANLFRAEFQGANLKYANLSNSHAKLDNMNGFGAYLNGADFSYANLSHAQLAAYFYGANFSYANLQNAVLIDSESPHGDAWRKVNFSYTNLKNACLGFSLCAKNPKAVGIATVVMQQALFCHTTMPNGKVNNRDCDHLKKK